MDKYLAHEEIPAAAATHAIVIGVGSYPYLIGGTVQPPSEHSDNMGQLTSPPVSAREVAEWLIKEYNNPQRPLASVALLLSETLQKAFTNPRTGRTFQPEEATYEKVAEAITAWALQGRTNPENLLIFYFCGHGISQGSDMTLLMSDYGKSPLAPLEQALNFSTFRLFMARNLPERQLYFVDACRASSDSLIEKLKATGRSPIQIGGESAAQAPVYFATLSGEDAFGRPNEVSVFTGALLKGLKGSGSEDQPVGHWRVTTLRLQAAIDFHVKQAFDAGAKRAQVPPGDALSEFEIHHLRSLPEVPVFVSCSPESENENAELVYESEGVEKGRRQRQSSEWELQLPAGMYRFAAEFPVSNRARINQDVHVHPVSRTVSLEVK